MNALLLTGGRSSRMGRDKARLTGPDGVPFAQRTAALLLEVADRAIEVGTGVTDLESMREDPPGSGPLTAVAAGAAALGKGPALVVACDLPRLTLGMLQWLVAHPSELSVVPVVDGRAQPLCARWSSDALQTAGDLVAAGESAMRALLGRAPVVLAPPSEWADAAGGVDALEDVDTEADLGRLLRP